VDRNRGSDSIAQVKASVCRMNSVISIATLRPRRGRVICSVQLGTFCPGRLIPMAPLATVESVHR
jgi:hypothetical protein